MKILMQPHLSEYETTHESGIKRVVEAYFKYLPQRGIELVQPSSTSYDLLASHAGSGSVNSDIAHLHGMYWTGDYHSERWQHGANHRIVETCRVAKAISVPSTWVAETIKRDMRLSPYVIPHGIEYEQWRHTFSQDGYVLWNKNRDYDVCDPSPVLKLAREFKDITFVTTFLPRGTEAISNTKVTGIVDHRKMKGMVQKASVYLSTTKETFGIGILEAIASGTPVLGFDYGGNSDIIKHGVTGYLAEPNNYEDLFAGLDYCLKYRNILSDNCRNDAENWSWDKAIDKLVQMYEDAYAMKDNKDISFIIPVHNHRGKLETAVQSVVNQTYPIKEIIIVDDCSTDDTEDIGKALSEKYPSVTYLRHDVNGGVAEARNTGILHSNTQYVCCLDYDDAVEPQFTEACMKGFENPRVGVSFTKLLMVKPDGSTEVSAWPSAPDYDKHINPRSINNLRGMNQVPTCAIFKKEAWVRAGGYNSYYSPLGAGAEDAEFWARLGALGYSFTLASQAPLFRYSIGTGLVSGAKGKHPDMVEPFWLSNKPWVLDKQHPFVSYAQPSNGLAHNVYQYDHPIISVIIPVGPGHTKILRNAIESVVGQTERRWEIIVVFDTNEEEPYYMSGYPFVKTMRTPGEGKRGAGYARNLGASVAKAPFLIFLDADDELHPAFMEKAVLLWREEGAIVYTDYIHKVETDEIEGFKKNEVLQYYPEISTAYIAGRSSDFDCERAQRMPDFEKKDLYHWCLVTCLIPKAWHDDIGGFDEEMTTFEDVLYHWKMARAGRCYVRLKDRLVMYSRDTGSRRELASFYNEGGLLTARKMLQYSRSQLERIKRMACKKCPGSRERATDPASVVRRTANIQDISDKDVILVRYLSGNMGNHRVLGMSSGRDYNYRKGGDVFLMLVEDMKAQPHLFEQAQVEDRIEVETTREQVRAPIPVVSQGFHLDVLPGMTKEIMAQMERDGIKSKEDIIGMGIEGLKKYKGIGDAKARLILEEVEAW